VAAVAAAQSGKPVGSSATGAKTDGAGAKAHKWNVLPSALSSKAWHTLHLAHALKCTQMCVCVCVCVCACMFGLHNPLHPNCTLPDSAHRTRRTLARCRRAAPHADHPHAMPYHMSLLPPLPASLLAGWAGQQQAAARGAAGGTVRLSAGCTGGTRTGWLCLRVSAGRSVWGAAADAGGWLCHCAVATCTMQPSHCRAIRWQSCLPAPDLLWCCTCLVLVLAGLFAV
jgi:hypothetical protein